ncbi:MAG: TfoX/Sxy family protein [Sulfitobacter sp.]
MSVCAADIAFACDLFSDQPSLTTRKMFGALGIYSEGVIFALVFSDGQVMLKAATAEFAAKLAAMGAERWVYTRKNGGQSAMPYWSLPGAALDDPELANELAREARAALG